jgi:hypothetical protein
MIVSEGVPGAVEGDPVVAGVVPPVVPLATCQGTVKNGL